MLQVGHIPVAMLIGSNLTEAKHRKGWVEQIMRRPSYRLCFPCAALASHKKMRQEEIRLANGQVILTAHGIESVPPGTHADLIRGDDVVNQGNTFSVPAKMLTVASKINDVIAYSEEPWTVLEWDTTPWRIGDPDNDLEDYATAHPESWTNCIIAAGGPETLYDKDGNVEREAWWSPWPAKWSAQILQDLHERNEFSYRRSMMMQRITDEEASFRQAKLFITDTDPLIDKCPAAFLETYHVAVQKRLDALPWQMGVDLAFTGSEQRLKDPRRYRKRSQTAILAGQVDPETKHIYVRRIVAEYLAPSEHEATIERMCRELNNCEIVGVEADKTVSEMLDDLESRGIPIDLYVPGQGKIFRKWPVAKAFNEGRAMLPGRLKYHGVIGEKNEPVKSHDVVECWSVVPAEGFHKLANDLLLFPLKLTDEIDALEVLIRTQLKLYGMEPEFTIPEKPEKDYRRVPGWRRPREEPPDGDPVVDELERLIPEPSIESLFPQFDKSDETENTTGEGVGHHRIEAESLS